MAPEPGDEDIRPVVASPDELALRVVAPSLRNRRAGQLRKVSRGADVVGVEMRDHDVSDLAGELRELGGPSVPRVGETEPRVDHRPPVVAREDVGVHVARPGRQRERHATDAAAEVVHADTLCAATRPSRTSSANALNKKS